jgi:predicted ABC-type transport system involved in lysophospholipase L1 biosynthesis ATPase subunit
LTWAAARHQGARGAGAQTAARAAVWEAPRSASFPQPRLSARAAIWPAILFGGKQQRVTLAQANRACLIA